MSRPTKFVVMPTIVTGPGIYRTRCGELVTVREIKKAAYGAIGTYSCGTPEQWDVCGRVLPFNESGNDIVCPVLPPPNQSPANAGHSLPKAKPISGSAERKPSSPR